VVSSYDFGLRLNDAPQIDEDVFIGRDRELEQLRTWLTPRPKRQNVVALCGLGGMGKTQLSIQFARKFVDTYSSIFWLNGKDENTLKAGLAALAAQVVENYTPPSVNDAQEQEQEQERMAQQARQWLSRPDNDRWLVVYDNYDDPRLPGMDSSTGYDIRHFFPHRAHGSILITTRSPRLTYAKQLRLNKIDNIDQSLSILATRSGREINGGEEIY
jgi:ATP/maltotriose-dependent transcriptional regulator MalT